MAAPLKPSSRRRSTWPGDVFICFVALFAVAAVLASPLVPYVFEDVAQLLRWSLVTGLPIATIGVVLNHWAEASETRRRSG